ncbi:hypothetical protein HZF05_13800 [Sphingomonas sp. CGMCC 1.13654]|uniref:Uncharacterized protein n=1 Tax=Sphingomonas chungangi TaxID=2683589 RepID=A0A838L9D8_9SPHN|nr:hypothetical protein [Sphingomonas chungangi]MBA2935159.1 hypothetical protein [Sphingomonas chungangi]MVW57723.1 hypothetical protein [Sphingomonas chungangi]
MLIGHLCASEGYPQPNGHDTGVTAFAVIWHTPMTDVLASLRERLGKSEGKVARYEKLLEAARKDVADVQTALRLVSEISGAAIPETPAAPADASKRQIEILGFVPAGRSNATAPASLFEAYNLVHAEPDNLDAFRTAVWRMKGKEYQFQGQPWIVHADDGKYWRERTAGYDDRFDNDPFATYGEQASKAVPPSDANGAASWDDSDVPF